MCKIYSPCTPAYEGETVPISVVEGGTATSRQQLTLQHGTAA